MLISLDLDQARVYAIAIIEFLRAVGNHHHPLGGTA